MWHQLLHSYREIWQTDESSRWCYHILCCQHCANIDLMLKLFLSWRLARGNLQDCKDLTSSPLHSWPAAAWKGGLLFQIHPFNFSDRRSFILFFWLAPHAASSYTASFKKPQRELDMPGNPRETHIVDAHMFEEEQHNTPRLHFVSLGSLCPISSHREKIRICFGHFYVPNFANPNSFAWILFEENPQQPLISVISLASLC